MIKAVIVLKFIEMTIEEALKYCKGNKHEKVLVAVYDLEDQNGIADFHKKCKGDCENIIKHAATIAQECDDFIDSLKCFSVKQDLKSIRPTGSMATILFHPLE